MSYLFATTDPTLYERRQRSIRIRGAATSIRLENAMWDVLAQMAANEGCTTSELICRLHDSLSMHQDGLCNFTTFLRVTCVRHLCLTRDGGLAKTNTAHHEPLCHPAPARH